MKQLTFFYISWLLIILELLLDNVKAESNTSSFINKRSFMNKIRKIYENKNLSYSEEYEDESIKINPNTSNSKRNLQAARTTPISTTDIVSDSSFFTELNSQAIESTSILTFDFIGAKLSKNHNYNSSFNVISTAIINNYPWKYRVILTNPTTPSTDVFDYDYYFNWANSPFASLDYFVFSRRLIFIFTNNNVNDQISGLFLEITASTINQLSTYNELGINAYGGSASYDTRSAILISASVNFESSISNNADACILALEK